MSIKRGSIIRGLIAAAAALSLALTGCVDGGGGTSQSDRETASGTSGEPADPNAPLSGEVEFWTINLRKNFQEYFDGLIADFEAENEGVKIKWVDVPGNEMQTKYLAALAAGSTPDVVNIDAKNFSQLANTLTDHAEFFSDEDLAIYQPGLVEGLKVDETLYGVPWYNSGTLVGVYRKSVVDKVGFDPENPPQNWEEVLQFAEKVHAETGVYGTNADPGLRVLQGMGVQFVNEDLTQATFATEDAATKVKLFQDAYKSGAIAPGASAADTEEPQTIDNGEIAFKADYNPGRLKNLAENAPEAYNDLYVTTAPRNAEGKDQLPGQMALSIPSGSDNKAAAAAFLKHVTSAESQLAFCEQVAIFPSTVETLEAPMFAENPGQTPEEQARKIIVENFANAVDTTVPLPASVPDQLRQDFIVAMKELMRSGDDPMVALQEQQEIWQAALDSAPRGS